MKTNLFLLNRSFLLGAVFSLSSLIGVSQNVNIPDANFKAALVVDASINTNGDGEIQVSEAAAFAGVIDVGGYNISDLTGIEAFTALTHLVCNNNQLTSLDVSDNTALSWLNCSDNQLTSLNVSANTALTDLYCWNNLLTSLNVSGATALTYLVCSGNQLTSLNVSANTALTYLSCFNNQLTSLNVQNGNNNNLDEFYASYNPNLTCIEVDDVAWSTANWTVADGRIDAAASFSVDCP